MIEHYLLLSTILQFFSYGSKILPVLTDIDTTMTTTWLLDLSAKRSSKDIVINDENSGCICRLKLDKHIVCYGVNTCKSFPKNVRLPPGVYDFRLKTTKISQLKSGELFNLRLLKKLNIDANFNLKDIEQGFFAGMSKMVYMSLSFNTELKFLRENVFNGLDKLERLKLIKNGFHNILDASQALKPTTLPKVISISLSQNAFRELNETAFDGMTGTHIKELDITLCQIEKIHPNALKPFKHLEKLRIGENALNEDELMELLQKMIKDNIRVKLLSLYKLGFRMDAKLTALLRIIADLKVSHLNLRRNHIENLYEGLFPYMPQIRILDLREVSASEIEFNAFNPVLMPHLETLLLGGNRLPGIVSGIRQSQLLHLDLSENSGDRLSPSYFDVNSNIFENMTKLTSLNLSFNRIATISNKTFRGVSHLRILGLKNATIFYIAVNSFITLRNLFLLNLEDNPFAPFNTFPDLIFEGLGRLEVLLLSNCKIAHFLQPNIFKSLTVLRYLNLKGNNLVRIDSVFFVSLISLISLDLSYNRLTPWDHAKGVLQFNSNLRILLLSHNRFTYLTGSMMDDFICISHLDIGVNPYICNSKFLKALYMWLLSRNLTLNETHLFDPLNVCLSPDEWRDKPLIDFLRKGETFSSSDFRGMNRKKYVGIVLLFALCLILIFSFLCYCRSYFRYWILLLKMSLLRLTTKNNVNLSYKYDAFISYSHEDRNFVFRMVSKLEHEEPYLKLCIYERDFEIGTIITESVMDKLYSSRKIVFVVSNNFARSQWCIWELQLAESNRAFFRMDSQMKHYNDSMIMIKMGPLTRSLVSPMLKHMLETRIYLEWSSEDKKQKIFWDKLKNCLMSNSKVESR